MSAGFNKPNAILGLGLVAAGGAALLANQRQRGVRKQFPKRQRREDRQFVIDMISGGVGEASTCFDFGTPNKRVLNYFVAKFAYDSW